MKNIDLKTIPVSGLATLLTKYETEYLEAIEQGDISYDYITNIHSEANSRGVDLYNLYKNERRI